MASVFRSPERGEGHLPEGPWRSARARLLTELFGLRARLGPALAVIAAVLVALDPVPWRMLVAGSAALAMIALFLWEARYAREHEVSEMRLFANLVAIAVGQLMIIVASGGLASPPMPGMMLVALILNLLFVRRLALPVVLGLQLPSVWALAWMHHAGVLPTPRAYDGFWTRGGEPGWGPFLAASFYSLMLLGTTVIARRVRGALEHLLVEHEAARDRELAMHEEQARTLTALTAEIAHELKNPLASVKGLSALVRKDLAGQSAERMDVLRREVDRMQAILDEFLTYSRPLVPLDESHVDLAELCRDVATLHEGVARSRGIELSAPREAVHVRCDPRKVRQVLVNLVQNAIDASPDDGEVRLVVERDAREVRVRVRDSGPGIAADVRERLFTAGATTKPKGNGLGLVVARGLARQHGGELVLEDADGGGSVATLTLPLAGARAEAA